MANRLVLAVAGSGKTRFLVDHCAGASAGTSIAVVTYTHANQVELRGRLRTAGVGPNISVHGWYSFLLQHFVRPFLPFKFPGERVRGFVLESPNRFARGRDRFLTAGGAAYAYELGRLAFELIEASDGALLRRLTCCCNEVLIDEVQDLAAHDWGVIDTLLAADLEVLMVGDLRQAVLSTNPRSAKNKSIAYSDVIKWFKDRESKGALGIEEMSECWRCRPEITRFSDTIFDNLDYPKTTSRNTTESEHDGVFIVRPAHVDEYVRRFNPRCLRHSKASAKKYDHDFLNFGESKGLAFDRVLIFATEPIKKFVREGVALSPRSSAALYVAVTRARQSVGIVMNDPGDADLPVWDPELEH